MLTMKLIKDQISCIGNSSLMGFQTENPEVIRPQGANLGD